MTEPWRFIVYAGDKAREFATAHAELYKSKTENFDQGKYDKIMHNGNNVSHIVVAIMKRSETVDIPEIEEICSTAAAIENILTGATAAGIASFWSTGGMVHKKAMKKFLGLMDKDIVMGILYLGYSDIVHTGKRVTPIQEKVSWKK
jgi:nitroreductase